MVLAHLLVRSQLTVYVRFIPGLSSFPLVSGLVPHCFNYCGFVVSCEIRKCGLLALFSFLQFVLAIKVT